MKVAMKGAMQPLKSSTFQTAKRPVTEPTSSSFNEPEPVKHRSILRPSPLPGTEPLRERQRQDDGHELPLFCQNCGKKIPPAANFCPGCERNWELTGPFPLAHYLTPPFRRKRLIMRHLSRRKELPAMRKPMRTKRIMNYQSRQNPRSRRCQKAAR